MAKSFDPTIVNPILTGFIEDLLTAKGNFVPTKPFEITTRHIEEYEDRMRVKATDKFDVAVFISTINFYLTQADLVAHKARGAMIIYLDIEIADKIFKAAGLQVPYDEDDESMLELGGKLCSTIANAFKDQLSAAGYPSLELSAPEVFKNSIPHGVEFSKDQDETQEIAFFFLKHKALVVEWTLAPIPKK